MKIHPRRQHHQGLSILVPAPTQYLTPVLTWIEEKQLFSTYLPNPTNKINKNLPNPTNKINRIGNTKCWRKNVHPEKYLLVPTANSTEAVWEVEQSRLVLLTAVREDVACEWAAPYPGRGCERRVGLSACTLAGDLRKESKEEDLCSKLVAITKQGHACPRVDTKGSCHTQTGWGKDRE